METFYDRIIEIFAAFILGSSAWIRQKEQYCAPDHLRCLARLAVFILEDRTTHLFTMSRHLHLNHHVTRLHTREAVAFAEAQPLEFVHAVERQFSGLHSLFKRGADQSTPNQSNNVTVPVALGVVYVSDQSMQMKSAINIEFSIPIALAVIIFVYLHRRHVKRLRAEDANDPHKSLDFGWDPAKRNPTTHKQSRKERKNPEMSIATEKRPGHDRGLSMDMDLDSPYVLPPALHGSRASLHSMSRTIHSQDDRYRPATTYVPNDGSSVQSYTTRRGGDDSSSQSGPSIRGTNRDDMNQDLLRNAQRMSRSVPPTNRVPDVPQIRVPESSQQPGSSTLPASQMTPSNTGLSPNGPRLDSRDSYVAGDQGGLRRSNTYLGRFISTGASTSRDTSPSKAHVGQQAATKELPEIPPPTLNTAHRKSPPRPIEAQGAQYQNPTPQRQQSLLASQHASIDQNFLEDSSDFGDSSRVIAPSLRHSQEPQGIETRGSSQAYMQPIDEYSFGMDENAGLGFDPRRISMGMRPLPPDDPTDNPEQRANRIRSFYKEYFDDSRPNPAGTAAPAGGYYEDYDQNYLGDGATYFDPVSGQFVTTGPRNPRQQHAEPYGRRAMTPPPGRTVGRRRHAATMSGGVRPTPPGSRAYSSASSSRFGPSGRSTPKKRSPPPEALRVIPSPSLMKEDAFALPIDFAPPTSARERQQGRPDSPRGGLRLYSPMVPAHMPLQSSYDDLAVMPSP